MYLCFQGSRTEGELITLKLTPLAQAWRHTPDAKCLSALVSIERADPPLVSELLSSLLVLTSFITRLRLISVRFAQTLYRELQAEGTLPPMGLPDEAGIAAVAAPMEKEDATRRARRSSTEMYDDEDATTRARRSSTGIQCSDEDVSLSRSYTQGVVYILWQAVTTIVAASLSDVHVWFVSPH